MRRLHPAVAAALGLIALAGCPSSTLPGLEPDMSAPAPDLSIPSGCNDHVLDNDETATDCGGPTCMPCDTGDACIKGRDCASGLCTNAKCDAPSCSDGAKNGTESDRDCGGTCPGCDLGKKCNAGTDCASKTCTNGVCMLGPCMNGKQDGSETDTDCGGTDCGPCDDGKMCVLGTDCKGMMCTNNVCHGAIMCVAPMANCDGNPLSGCNVDLDTDAKNCGKCGMLCANNAPSCSAGKCVKPSRVLIVGQDGLVDVKATLEGTKAFSVVDIYYTQNMGGDVPLNKLMTYDMVLVTAGGVWDSKILGDTLAAYFDNGGDVVFSGMCTPMAGRWFTDGYYLLQGGAISYRQDSIGNVAEPNSPIMVGVKAIDGNMIPECSFFPLPNGSTVVAEWKMTNLPLVVRGQVKGRNRVDLNLYAPSGAVQQGSWTGDGAVLLKNALLYR